MTENRDGQLVDRCYRGIGKGLAARKHEACKGRASRRRAQRGVRQSVHGPELVVGDVDRRGTICKSGNDGGA